MAWNKGVKAGKQTPHRYVVGCQHTVAKMNIFLLTCQIQYYSDRQQETSEGIKEKQKKKIKHRTSKMAYQNP